MIYIEIDGFGPVMIEASSKGIKRIEFVDDENVVFSGEERINSCSIIQSCVRQLDEYFAKKRRSFDLPLDMEGSQFQKRVWNELLTIPFGTVRSYKDQAIALGDIKAIRAVAKANGANKIAIVVPCHRIIGSDHSLTGYAGGLWRKKALLELESNQGSLF